MMKLRRLPVGRQRAAGEGLRHRLEKLSAEDRAKLDTGVMASANRVIAKSDTLTVTGGAAKLTVDNAGDQVTSGLHTIVEAVDNGLTDAVVPLSDEARARKAAAQLVLRRAFPLGTRFLRDDMTLQYAAMRKVVSTLHEADVKEAIDVLGLGYYVRHIEAHLEPYGVAAGGVGQSPAEKASDEWHEAFEDLVIDVRKVYRGDAAKQALFLSDYEKELAAHIADQQAARRARKKNL